MSVARPAARSLLRGALVANSAKSPSASSAAPATCHHLHSSAQLAARRRPRFSSVRAAEMGLVSSEAVQKFTKDKFPEYDESEKDVLSRTYTKAQLDALEAGEAAIDPKDFTVQGRIRVDPYRLPYIDDFSTVKPVVDKRPRTRNSPSGDAKKINFMDNSDFTGDLIKWAESFDANGVKWDEIKNPEELKELIKRESERPNLTDAQLQEEIDKSGPKELDALKFWVDRSSITGQDGPSQTALAPALPHKVPGVAGLYTTQEDPEDEGRDPEGIFQGLKKQTGMTLRQMNNLRTKSLVSRSVTNQTRLGKIRKSSILYIAGDGEGRLGLGLAKSVEPAVAQLKARMLAIRNMQPIPRYEERTIYGNVEGKVGGTVVQLMTRPPGFGLRVPEKIFEMCRAAGIQDIACRIPRSRNPMNTVKAAYQALMNQRNPEEIAIGRGKKMVDVRKVYYGGAVY